MRILTTILTIMSVTFLTNAQTTFRNDPTTIKESGYSIVNASNGYKVNVAIIASNPYDNRFASRPTVQVTLRGTDNSIIGSSEIHGAGIPPLATIALCETIRADEKPSRIEFRPLAAWYEATDFKPVEFKNYTLSNISARPNNYGYLKITGEIKNPYPKEAGAWICFLYRDKQGKLLGGHHYWKSELPAGDPSSFETSISLDEIPENLGSIDKMAFSHNNYQSSWQEILRK